MELQYGHCPAVSSISRNGLREKSFLLGQSIINLPSNNKNFPDIRRIKFLDFRDRASGTKKIRSQAQDAAPSNVVSKDGNLVYVAGATGKVGSRTVREFLKLGYKVRAGVRSVKRAEPLVQSIQNLKLEGVGGDTKLQL